MRRLRTGSLIAVFRGVYRVGHRAPSVEARYMAAVKAAGEGALLSGLAAAWLWGLVKGWAPPPEVIGPDGAAHQGGEGPARTAAGEGGRDGLARRPGDDGAGDAGARLLTLFAVFRRAREGGA